MTYQTDERLKGFLDTNQLHREQLCRSILAIDKRFSDVRPRHPRGGPDGGRDMEATYKNELLAYGAVGFVNQANDSKENKKYITDKFIDDLNSALEAEIKPNVFVFFTNVNLTIGEKESLIEQAHKSNITHCEIIDRERIRISLDSPDGFSIRFQYLNLSLSEAEQASFFARWGDDIQSIISTGFQRIENTLNRVLFLQESADPLNHFTLSFELKRKYSADEIGHFRLFCSMQLKEPKQKIFEVIFGISDKSKRMWMGSESDINNQLSGIKHGISGGQWESYLGIENQADEENEDAEKGHYEQVGGSTSVGRNEIEFLPISYSKDTLIRFSPTICLKDLDEATFLPILNSSLAEKVKAIHIYSNGYKIQELGQNDLTIDPTGLDPSIPVKFTTQELEDKWVRIRPSKFASAFHINYFDQTPKRMFVPEQVRNSLDDRKS